MSKTAREIGGEYVRATFRSEYRSILLVIVLPLVLHKRFWVCLKGTPQRMWFKNQR